MNGYRFGTTGKYLTDGRMAVYVPSLKDEEVTKESRDKTSYLDKTMAQLDAPKKPPINHFPKMYSLQRDTSVIVCREDNICNYFPKNERGYMHWEHIMKILETIIYGDSEIKLLPRIDAETYENTRFSLSQDHMRDRAVYKKLLHLDVMTHIQMYGTFNTSYYLNRIEDVVMLYKQFHFHCKEVARADRRFRYYSYEEFLANCPDAQVTNLKGFEADLGINVKK